MRKVLLAILASVALTVAVTTSLSPSIPRCAEDVVLVGKGSFEHGKWAGYDCGPAVDDFVGN